MGDSELFESSAQAMKQSIAQIHTEEDSMDDPDPAKQDKTILYDTATEVQAYSCVQEADTKSGQD